MNLESNIQRAALAVLESDAVMITAGAGMGVDSGLPDFRGNEGFWKAYPPIAKLGKSFAEMANPEWFFRDAGIAWAFYGHRLNMYRQTKPHQGFDILRDIAADKSDHYFVFTSNVDGHFQKAGFSDDRITECHGTINHFQCIHPCRDDIWSANHKEVAVDEELFRALEPLPCCPHCGAIARPNILMFGDWYWISRRTAAQEANLTKWMRTLGGKKPVIIECGAGLAVPTVRYQSERMAHLSGGTLIRINPRDCSVPSSGIALPLGALDGIERIYEALQNI